MWRSACAPPESIDVARVKSPGTILSRCADEVCRTNDLVFNPDGGSVIFQRPRPRRSDWIRNLRENPEVKVTRDGAEVSGIAEVVEDLERKRRIISENPFVIPPFAIVRAMAFGPMRPVTTAFLRSWLTSRPIIVIRT